VARLETSADASQVEGGFTVKRHPYDHDPRDSRLEGARDWAGRQLLVSRVKHDRRPGICRDNGRYVSKIAYRLDDTASEMKLVVYRDCEVTQAQLKEFDRLARKHEEPVAARCHLVS
jgi:hypothetical protein